jgi:hypothetical protein
MVVQEPAPDLEEFHLCSQSDSSYIFLQVSILSSSCEYSFDLFPSYPGHRIDWAHAPQVTASADSAHLFIAIAAALSVSHIQQALITWTKNTTAHWIYWNPLHLQGAIDQVYQVSQLSEASDACHLAVSSKASQELITVEASAKSSQSKQPAVGYHDLVGSTGVLTETATSQTSQTSQTSTSKFLDHTHWDMNPQFACDCMFTSTVSRKRSTSSTTDLDTSFRKFNRHRY